MAGRPCGPLTHVRERDAALAAGRALRNAGLGVGALAATACLTGGTTALQALAAITGLAYLTAVAWRGRSTSSHTQPPPTPSTAGPHPRMRVLLAANVIYVFCLNAPEMSASPGRPRWLSPA